MVKRYNYINTEKEQFDFCDKKIIIWGTSFSALGLYIELADIANVIGFTDSFTNEKGTFAGLPLYPYKDIEDSDVWIYISTRVLKYQIEILELLEDSGFNVLCRGNVWGAYEFDINGMNERIKKDYQEIDVVKKALCDKKSIQVFENLINYRISNNYHLLEEIYEENKQQYFPVDEILVPSENEVFVDAGAYNGDTTLQFTKWVNGKYKKIYALEPDSLMQNITEEYIRLNNLKNVELIRKGAYSSNGVLKFMSIAQSGSSNINENGATNIETVTIDSLVKGGEEPVTYIKMDIEGAEMEALIGARETIHKYKPNLAICIYHKDDDLWKIPYYIHKNYPFYKLYMRHYSQFTINETVLYGVKENE